MHGGGHVAHLVQEDGAAVRQLEPPLALADGAGEGALLVTEQLAFQQVFRQGRAVDGDHRPLAQLRGLVDGPRDHFLARSRLALDQHGGRGVRHVADQLEHGVHARVLADDVLEGVAVLELLAQVNDLVEQLPLAQGPLYDQAQMLEVDRLGDEVVGAQAHGLDRAVDAAVGGHEDDGDGDAFLLHGLHELEAVQARHAQVADDDAVVVLAEGLEGLAAVTGGVDRDLEVVFQELLEGVSLLLVIVDDQDPPVHPVALPARGCRFRDRITLGGGQQSARHVASL